MPGGYLDYDEESGQVFKEVSTRLTKRHGSDWIREYKTPSLLKKGAYRNENGARSLQDMATAQVARNMRNIISSHLRAMPWPVAEKLWKEIVSIRGESFHAWRVLASSHGDNFNTVAYRYYIELKHPPLPFADYYNGLTSPSLDWLTCLRVSPKHIDKADLVKIAAITNLAILDLSDNLETVDLTPSLFDERIFRTWAELARHDGAFKHLRTLLFGWQPALSTWMFKYLNDFPALRLLVATACPDFGQWNRRDWEYMADKVKWEACHAKKSVQMMRPFISDRSFHFGAVSSMLFSTDIFGPTTTEQPVLECWLGGPPAWENVWRDFPKLTQTVWLEKMDVTGNAPPPQRGLDPSKRPRDTEAVVTGSRTPPPKRNNARIRSNVSTKTAADLLADFSKDH